MRKVHVVYPISTDVIKPALRLRVARGHPGTRTDSGHIELDRYYIGGAAPARPSYKTSVRHFR